MSSAIRWSSACLTDVGVIRSENQDACLDFPEAGLWAVADGMGGHSEGEVASRLIVESLSQIGGHTRLSNFVNDVEDRLMSVHKELVDRAASKNKEMIIGSTVAVLLAFDEYSICLWAGDSRVYRYRDGLLEQITRDHSHVEELIELSGMQREEAEARPDANVITRAVGAGDELYLDIELQRLHHEDMYLICSDGLYREVSEAEISGYLTSGDCVSICNTLIALALERGAHDNVTVAVIKFDRL